MASAWKTEFSPEPEPETAIVPAGAVADAAGEPSDYSQSSSSDEDETDLPPGPIDPERCTMGGPGYQGGAAQAAVTFYVTAKDARGTRIREGGAYVVVRVTPGTSARAAGAEPVSPDVRDAGDGTYICTYSVPARGDYEVRRTLCFRSLTCVCARCLLLPVLPWLLHLRAACCNETSNAKHAPGADGAGRAWRGGP